ncbi:MAG: RidA family protein [Pseudomonadota bacterium]
MSPGFFSGGFPFPTGMTGSGPDGALPTHETEPFDAVFDTIDGVPAEVGLGLDAPVEMTLRRIGLRAHFETSGALRRRLPPPCPIWIAVEAAGRLRPGSLVEGRAIAAAPQA